MLYPGSLSKAGTIGTLKSFLFTLDNSVDPGAIKTVKAAQEKVLSAISDSNKPISSDVITQFSDLFYGSNPPIERTQKKVSERIRGQNVKENFKQAKIRFLITKALLSKLIKEAHTWAAKAALAKKIAKAREKNKWAEILAAGKYWEELAEFDRISEEKLLDLINKQHQEAMAQLHGLQETMKLLKRQLGEIDRYENQILDFHSKEIAVDLKGIKFKDGTSLFKGVSDQKMEEIAREYIQEDYEASKIISQKQERLDSMLQQKDSIEKQIKKDTQSSHTATFFENKKSDSDMGFLSPTPAMLPLKKHQEYMRKSESTHPLAEKLKALEDLVAEERENIRAALDEKENILHKVLKTHGLHEDAALIESHAAEFKEILHKKIEHKKEEAHNQLKFCDNARAQIRDQIKQVKEAGNSVLKAHEEELEIFRAKLVKMTGENDQSLKTFNTLKKEIDEFNFDDEALELAFEAKHDEKTSHYRRPGK